jgi:undecaprenyl diphosphate synthase
MSRNSALGNEAPESSQVPIHIAVIMDGNGRWATRQGQPRLNGHRRGYQTLREIVQAAAERGVKFLTAYAFSSENWRRPRQEVAGLMKLIGFAAQAECSYMMREGVRMTVSGRFHELPKILQKQLAGVIETTKDNPRITLNLAINYGGRGEIVDAAKRIAQMVKDGGIEIEQIDEALFSRLMYHPEIPDPDLLIRTAGEMRVSNFLTWESAYTELYVTDTLWPDFSVDELDQAIAVYSKRTRKFGAVVEETAAKEAKP